MSSKSPIDGSSKATLISATFSFSTKRPDSVVSWISSAASGKKRFDAVVDFHGGPKASLIAFLSGAPLKIGYEIPFRNFIYGVRIPRRSPEGPIHSVVNHINLVRPLGTDPGAEPPLRLPPATVREKENVRTFFRTHGLSARRRGPEAPPAETGGKKAVVLHIGAGTEFRAWGAASLTHLAARLSADGDVRVILIGGEEDRKTEAEILAGAPDTLSLVGRLNLIEIRELMARAALFAGPDSGPMHIATEAATPIVAWFGPTLPAHFSPWKPAAPVILVEKKIDCRPCRQKECVHGDFRCLRTITVDEVHEACRRLLGPVPKPPSV